MSATVRIAMWSGPRNISTAMMRAWENRPDTVVIDEPFYACFLRETNARHPGANEIIEKGETDSRKVIADLTTRQVEGRPIFYQKQMTHHLIPAIEKVWLERVTNCFLIRDPARVIASYIKKNKDPSEMDLGFPQQADIYERVVGLTRRLPPVIDADDVLRDPEGMLRKLCEGVGVAFDDRMLSWPAGTRETDGIWAKHWYAEVERSTSFQRYRKAKPEVPAHLREVHESCREIYDWLYDKRLK